MSDFNQLNNRAVWFDIPVADLDRAVSFYQHVLAIRVEKQSFGDQEFAVLEHEDGNGGCLVPLESDITDKGIVVYMNVEGRLEDAVEKTRQYGGQILQEPHSIGPYGFKAMALDSEGNRIALHSMDADPQS